MRRQRLLPAMLVLLATGTGIASAGIAVVHAFRPASSGGPEGPHYTSEPRQNRSEKQSGVVHALLINGGSQPASNYLSHLQHLQEMVELLRRRGVAPERIHVFSADGEDPAADLTTRDTTPPDFWLIEDTGLGNRLKPSVQLTDTSWRAVKLHPARLADLRQWFDAAQREILPGDRLLVFVTDHGGPGRSGPGSGTISLWHEQLTVRELRLLLDRLAPKVQVVTVMSQCYSGAFADLMYDGGAGAPPSGNTCGFFATSAEDKAYGCYPEGQDRDRIGYAFELIDALNHQSTVAQAHTRVMQSDSTPDRPRRTSDAYLSRLVSDEAKERGIERDELETFARQPDIGSKLDRFRDAAARGSDASWRFEVRKAAAERMRTILITIAGRELLANPDSRRSPRKEAGSPALQREALDALMQCEALAPGDLQRTSASAPSASHASFPPLVDDIQLLQELQPTWLGVRYGVVPAALRNAYPTLSGAAHIQAVEERSPAAEAGLKPGDLVLGPPNQPFKASYELRDWTMTSPR